MIEAALRTILAHPKNPESFAHAKRVLDHHDANPQQGATSMSLETVIQENTAAIRDLIATMAAKAPAASVQAKIEKAVADKGIAGAKEEVKKIIAEEKKQAAEEPRMSPEDILNKKIKPAALQLVNKIGRDAYIAFLFEKFGIDKSVAQADPKQYGEILDAINAAIAEPGV